MGSLSVIVGDFVRNERFLKRLFTEIGDEFKVDIEDDTISFYDINDNNSMILCDGLAKAIIQEYEKKLLVKAVNKTCGSYAKSEKMEIWKMSMNHLFDDSCQKNMKYYSKLNSVKNSLYNYLKDSQVLSLEGFVNFRLGDYNDELEEVAEISAQEYAVDLEYKEFIMMLKYFVSLQPPKYLVVEVEYGTDVLIYGDGKNVTEECIKEYKAELGPFTDNIDDFVLNSLVIIAPKQVKFSITDRAPEKELITTVKGVFGDRVVVCNKRL